MLVNSNIHSIEELYHMSAEEIVNRTQLELTVVEQFINEMKEFIQIVDSDEMYSDYETIEEEVVEEVYECPNCGSRITEDMNKCPNCGIELAFE